MATTNQPVGGRELSNECVNEVHLICVNEYIHRFHSPKSKGTETPKALHPPCIKMWVIKLLFITNSTIVNGANHKSPSYNHCRVHYHITSGEGLKCPKKLMSITICIFCAGGTSCAHTINSCSSPIQQLPCTYNTMSQGVYFCFTSWAG